MARNAPRAAPAAPVAAPTTDAPEAAPEAAAPEAAPARFRLPLDAFCAGLSAADRRVELIAAFHHDEKAAGRLLDEHDAYAARYDAFARRPA